MHCLNRYSNDPKMVIYQILNTSNGKSYVGQAVHGFHRRYGSRSWWKYVQNTHLKRAIAKYGHEVFKVHLLEIGVSSEEELDTKEKMHIARLNCICPNGYNYQAGGQETRNRKHHLESRDKMALSLSHGKKRRLLDNHTGIIHEFVNVKRFADEHGLSDSSLSILMSEIPGPTGKPRYMQHRGWSLPKYPLRRIRCFAPDGSEYTILDGEIKGFCRQMGICSAGVFKVINGQHKQSLGWRFEIVPSLCPVIA